MGRIPADIPPSPIGVAVVGVGYWGPNLVRNFAAHPGWDLRWVCDADVERARHVASEFPSAHATADIADVLADGGVAAVAICTQAATHHALGMAALDAGRHVLVEKPMATSVADGESMVRAAQERNLVLMCDHTFCYTPAVQAMRRMVRDGSIGEIYYLDSIRVNLGLVQTDVDVFWDLASHDLSILDHLLPADVRPVSVAAYGADPIGLGRPCVGYLTMPLSTGAIVHVSVSWLSPVKVRQTILAGSRSMLIWDDMKPYQRLTVVDCGVEVAAMATSDARRELMVSYRVGDMVIPALQETGEALAGVVGEFADAITTGRVPLTGGLSGLRVLGVLEAAGKSMADGGAQVAVPTGPG